MMKVKAHNIAPAIALVIELPGSTYPDTILGVDTKIAGIF